MGRPKLLLPWGATTVIGRLLAQWRSLRPRQIAIVRRRADRPLLAELRRLRFPARQSIINPDPARGMFSSIQCAAGWNGWRTGLTAWVIALGDQPQLRTATLRALLAFHREHPQAICHPTFAGHRRHPVVLPREAFLELRHSPAPTLKHYLQQTTIPQLDFPFHDPGLPLDLDYPEDYLRMAPLLKR